MRSPPPPPPRGGEVAFTVGEHIITATAGDTVTGPAFVPPHRFENVGSGTMHLIGIHASAVIIQTVVE